MGAIRRAVFIVTYAKTKKGIIYLILKRYLHWKGWEFPKGGIERYEIRRLTIKREVKEETGLKPLKIMGLKRKGVYRYKKEYPDRPKIKGQTYKLYAAEIPYQKKIRFDKREHSSYKWCTYKEALKRLTWKNQKECLKIANNYLKGKIRI